MVKELYQIKTKELTLNITNGEIDSVRKKNLTKSGCRVYDNGCIGIEGVLGEPTQETWEKAERALALNIPYLYEPTKNLVKSRTLGAFVDEKEFISKAELLLKTLKTEFPEFVFSNKIEAGEETTILKNDAGLDLCDTQCYVSVGIIVKEESSPNVFDSVIEWIGREFDYDKILETARNLLRAHLNPVELPKEKIPVLFGSYTVSSILGDYLHAQKLKKGASLLSGKEGTKVFSDKLTLSVSRGEESYVPFFDAEGTIVPNERFALIENGVLLRGVADKLCAEEFGMELSSSAYGGYDDVPMLAVHPFTLDLKAAGTVKEILDGKDAILICMASGGDITPAGDYATPVQTAYLCRDGKLVGRVPEFNARGNIFDMLGKNYLGTSSDKPFEQKLTALYCTVEA